MNKRILPVLVDGAEPLSRSDLPDDLAALTDLHSVPFDEESDLDIVVRDLQSHLHEIDRERARIGGLAHPIELAPYRVGILALAGTLIAMILGAVAGRSLMTAFPGTDPVTTAFQDHATPWLFVVAFEVALWSGLAVLGHHFLWTHLVGLRLVRVRWRPVLVAFGITILVVAWVVAGFAGSPPLAWGAARTWLLMSIFVVLMGPWILTALGVVWTTPLVDEYELGKRARIIGELDRVSTVAAAVIVAAVLPLVVAAAAFTRVNLAVDPPLEDRGAGLILTISWGLLLSAVIVAVVLWSRMQLRNASTALLRDLKDITPQYRRNAEAHLVTQTFEHHQRWMLLWLLAPLALAVSALVWV